MFEPTIEDVPPDYIRVEHGALLNAFWPDKHEQDIRIAAVRDLLPEPDKADLLPGAVAYICRMQMVDLLTEFPGQDPAHIAWLAEAIVLFALLARSKDVGRTVRRN